MNAGIIPAAVLNEKKRGKRAENSMDQRRKLGKVYERCSTLVGTLQKHIVRNGSDEYEQGLRRVSLSIINYNNHNHYNY